MRIGNPVLGILFCVLVVLGFTIPHNDVAAVTQLPIQIRNVVIMDSPFHVRLREDVLQAVGPA